MGVRMKRLLLIVLPISLFVFSCEEEQSEDTTPPTVTITSPQTNSTVFEIVTITYMSSDNEAVEKVELWVNGVTTGLIDETETYSFEWNTILVDNGNYTISIRSYDISGNTTDSEPIVLIVDNPTEVTLWGVVYSVESTTEIDLMENGLTGEIPSGIGNLTNLTSFNLSENELTGLIPSEIGNLVNLDFLDISDSNEHYGGNLTGPIPSEIGNLINLTRLSLEGNFLTGSIPSEIGNLINLNELFLLYNQLTGVIPQSICNLTDLNYCFLENNQLCPPYPSCIEDYVGEQDTSNCGD